jgi:hypothetical protein
VIRAGNHSPAMARRRGHRLLAAMLAVGVPTAAQAAIFLVDTSSDDGGPAFQVCDGSAGNGNCSLRGAINALNAQPGPHTVFFNLAPGDPGFVPGSNHWRISTGSDLPVIERDLEINGYSQPGAVANLQTPAQGGSTAVLKIELRSGSTGQGAGLTVGGGSAGLRVQGLAINGYQRNILLFSPGSHRIEGCFIGTGVDGLALPPGQGGAVGITLAGTAIVGGTAPATRNVIAGHSQSAIQDFNMPTLATIQGNLIGVDASGQFAPPGQAIGLSLSFRSQGSTVGGGNPLARNVIAGFQFQALAVFSTGMLPAQPPLRIQGNYLGTTATGGAGIGNGLGLGAGTATGQIQLFGLGSCGTAVGGSFAGEGNLIAYGLGAGIEVAGCRDAPLVGNRFARNRGLPVDLGISFGDGLDGNDPGDGDGAPGEQAGNRLQNRPELIALVPVNGGADLALTYRVDTAPEHASWPLQIRIERGAGGQPTDLVALDSYPVSAAQQERTVVFPSAALAGSAPVLSATDQAGNSSEFASDALLFSDFE